VTDWRSAKQMESVLHSLGYTSTWLNISRPSAHEGGRAIAVAILILLASCVELGRTPLPPIAFKIEAYAGCTVAVRVYSYGMRLNDATLERLVKVGMERQLGGAPSLTCLDQAQIFVVWRVSARSGRPSKTFVGGELSYGDSKPSFAYSLIVGADDPLITSELIEAVNMLTRRISKGLDRHPGAAG
jgi:hypothetical protein